MIKEGLGKAGPFFFEGQYYSLAGCMWLFQKNGVIII